jgi:hypothetical protein
MSDSVNFDHLSATPLFNPSSSEKPAKVRDLRSVFVKGASIERASQQPLSLEGRVSLGPPAPVSSSVSFHIDVSPEEAMKFVQENAMEPRCGPDLIRPSDEQRVALIDRVYQIRKNPEAKEAYRSLLLDTLYKSWIKDFGAETAEALKIDFLSMVNKLSEDGVSVFGDLINKMSFAKLVDKYSSLLSSEGNKTWLHSYVDLRNHPEFLMDKEINHAFLSPLAVALISYKMGGPVRINDARGKDTEPMAAVTLDNMFHLDNVPFTPEYKVTVFWRQGTTKGPNGQCFVCLPSANKCPRASDGMLVDGKPVPFASMTEMEINREVQEAEAKSLPVIFYTSEAGSVFRTFDELKGALDAQQEVRGEKEPLVIALRDEDRVLTSIAETGNLPHHRYRLKEGDPRSCLLIAFHLIDLDPGQLVRQDLVDQAKDKVEGSDLHAFLISGHKKDDPSTLPRFLKALNDQSPNIGKSLQDLSRSLRGEKVDLSLPAYINPEDKALKHKELAEWKESVLHGPGTEKIKREQHILAEGQVCSSKEFFAAVKKLMAYDKTGVLELILYSDGREEKRKWARNQIRELRLEREGEIVDSKDQRPPSLDKRLADWESSIVQPDRAHLLNKEELSVISTEIKQFAEKLIEKKAKPTQFLKQKIGDDFVFPSLAQLIGDLSIAIVNCSNREAFLSTGLFIFWSCDTLLRAMPEGEDKGRLYELGTKVLQNYVATSALIETQIRGQSTMEDLDIDDRSE